MKNDFTWLPLSATPRNLAGRAGGRGLEHDVDVGESLNNQIIINIIIWWVTKLYLEKTEQNDVFYNCLALQLQDAKYLRLQWKTNV